MRVGVVVQKIFTDCIDDRTRDLGAARTIKVGDRITIMSAFQGREASSNLRN